MALLGLVMIVKNEAHGIAETIASVRSHIDRWTILDTGSTDGTQYVIRRELESIPGQLIEEPFVDFATSRNRALELHGTSTTFTIMLDSDDRLHVIGDGLRKFLSNARPDGAHLIQRRGDTSWWVPLVLFTPMRWRYAGRVHEYIAGGITTSRIPHVSVSQVRGPRSSAASRARWERDLALLLEDDAKIPNEPRTVFYLAQTYECLGSLGEAAQHYQRRIDIGGWADETFEAMLRKAKIRAQLEHAWPDVQQAFLEAHAFDPSRAEPLIEIAEHWRAVDNMPLCYLFASRALDIPMPSSGLFVDVKAYELTAADLVAISAFYVGRQTGSEAVFKRGQEAAWKAWQARPTDERVIANLGFYDGH